MNRPYFEMKVVKVKKEEKEEKSFVMYCKYHNNCEYQRIEPYKILKEQNKGTWVNGECIDKIKFPCFCSYIVAKDIRHYGQLHKAFFRGDYYYFITDGTMQYIDADCEQFYHSSNVEQLFKDYDIHIKRGKMIIFDEEEGK